MNQFKWMQSRPTKGLSFPTSREGATLTFVAKLQQVVLFGGISNGRMNDIMIFDIQKDEWRTQLTQGRQPSPRCYHTAFYDEKQNTLYFYGGQGDKGRSMTDFYVLSFNNFIWKRLFLLEGPPNRHNHTMSDLPGQEKLIFGGACLPEDIMYNDVWIFNYAAVQFTNSQEIPGAVCTKKICKGEVPPPRAGHGAVVYQNNLYVFGGRCTDSNTTIYRLSLESLQWRKVQHYGKPPNPRAYFSTHLINGQVIIFGGSDAAINKVLNETYVLNLTDYHWSAPFTAGNIPSARYAHCSCAIEDIILIMGGIDQTYCSMDMYFLQQGAITQDAEWEQISQPTEKEKLTMDTANSMIMEGKMYLQRIEDAMMRERLQMSELQKDVQHLQEEADNLQIYINQQRTIVENEHTKALKNNKQKEQGIETLFLMVKQEQMLTKQFNNKNRLIEECIKNQYQLVYALDQFYASVRRISGNEPAEVKVKKLADLYYNDILKAKDSQLEALNNLKQTYRQFEQLSQSNQHELDKQRDSVKDINTEFEQLIFETEHE